MIILTVCLFGTRRGMLAGAIGAGFPTSSPDTPPGSSYLVLKGGWALIMGLIMYRLLPHFKYSWLAGAVTGGIFHVIGYTLVKIPLYGGGVGHGRVLHPGGSDGCRDRPGRRGLHSPVQIPGHPEPAGEISLKSKKITFFQFFYNFYS